MSAARTCRVALTGGIATGKTYVRRQLEALGVPTIDSDLLARDAVAPGTPGLAAVVARFGPDVLDERGALSRGKLASIVFSDGDARRDLEAIVHPVVRQRTEAWFASLNPAVEAYAVADIPLLYEVGREGAFDAVVVVACQPDTQLRRIIERDGASEEQARARIAAQWPIAEKVRRANYVVSTDGTPSETDEQVRNVHREILRADARPPDVR